MYYDMDVWRNDGREQVSLVEAVDALEGVEEGGNTYIAGLGCRNIEENTVSAELERYRQILEENGNTGSYQEDAVLRYLESEGVENLEKLRTFLGVQKERYGKEPAVSGRSESARSASD